MNKDAEELKLLVGLLMPLDVKPINNISSMNNNSIFGDLVARVVPDAVKN